MYVHRLAGRLVIIIHNIPSTANVDESRPTDVSECTAVMLNMNTEAAVGLRMALTD